MNKLKMSFILSFFITFINAKNLIKIESINEENVKIDISVTVKKNDFILKDYLDISLDNPNIEILNIEYSIEPKYMFIGEYNKRLAVFDKDFTISLNVRKINNTNDETNLFLSFYKNNSESIQEKVFTLDLFKNTEPIQEKQPKPQKQENKNAIKALTKKVKKNKKSFFNYVNQLSIYTQKSVKNNDSNILRFIFVFILGLLMSLTPCIYPMIPITAGILQAQASKSLFKNFMLSLSYTVGIATTFAVFGLSAAFTGNILGRLLMHPLFVLFIVIVLSYFAFSMLGLYEIYIPNFLQSGASANVNGSYISAFVFGAVSGSVASPCLSPGLALLLTIVAALGSKILGFLLLFTFGIGLGIPLLIIGTFSSSLNVLPSSGYWMIEVKKLFGFMLFGMCFYYLSNVMSYNTLIWFIALSILATGIYYLKNITSYDSKFWRNIKNIFGIGLSACSIVLFSKAYQITFYPQETIQESPIWLTDYDKAKYQAVESSKKLFIDIGAEFCSLCKTIDSKLFNDEEVKSALEEFINVKVDATDEDSYPYNILKKDYHIMGVPTILLIDPKNNKLIKKWGGELSSIEKEEFIEELNILNEQ